MSQSMSQSMDQSFGFLKPQDIPRLDSVNVGKESDLCQIGDTTRLIMNKLCDLLANQSEDDLILDPDCTDTQINKTLEALAQTVAQLEDTIVDNPSNYLSISDLISRLHALNDNFLTYFQNEYKYLKNSFNELESVSVLNRLFGFIASDESIDLNDSLLNATEDTSVEQTLETSLEMTDKKSNKRRKRTLNLKRQSTDSSSYRLYYCYTDGCGGRQYFGLSSIQKHIRSKHFPKKSEEESEDSFEQSYRFQPNIDLIRVSNDWINNTPKELKIKPKKSSTNLVNTPKQVVDVWKTVYYCKTDNCNKKYYKLSSIQKHIRNKHFH